ncbi:Immunoglobulin A1 protease precursor [Gemella haemolysans]|uniref:LPXTG-motif cell wall anchor domain protein n=2 Tax=Gemella haemolysans TaxID=1379 RepID=C5NYF3_9BACL|nr:ZmpA/ZmpB/ZmpC family metallo-endopeptidase [Gemella haemolysans]EER68011.1 LPXTG-motif cell wall anchor domain protein [Gemella haemolysans ATCC 10379]VEI38730.1 Immunoglobulin A1 protease precursor [Gemella haemolysans]
MTIGSFFLVSTVQPEDYVVKAADNAIVHYKYVGEDNLTDKEKELIKKEVPSVVSSKEETYYLVFKPTKTTQLNKLPNTGLNYGVGSMLLGGMLGLVVVVVAKGKNKSRKILSILLVTSLGATTLELPARAMEDLQLSVYNMDYNLKVGDKLPEISSIPGYSFVGFIKNEAETKKENEEVKEQITSQQHNKKQPELKENTDENVIENKQENKTTLKISDKKEDKKVIENINKKDEKKVQGVNTVNPQDEVLAGKLTKPELLYSDKIIETPLKYNQIIESNDQLPEGTTRIKQQGKEGKKTEVIRMFTVEGKEVSRELISTKTEEPVSEIIEKGTKKAVSNVITKGQKLVKPAVEVKPEYTGVQAGAIVEPVKAEVPKEYTGVQAGAIVEPAKVETPKEYTGVQAGAIVEPAKAEVSKEYTGVQAGTIVEPAKAEVPKEYTGVQAGAIVEPEKVEPQYGGVTSGALVKPEKIEAPKEYTGVQAGAVVEPAKAEAPKEYRGVQAGAIVEPEKIESPKEYTGVQAGAVVEPAKAEVPKEYRGVQAGAIVEPEKIESPKEYTGEQSGAIVEPEKVETTKEYTGIQAGALVEPEKVEAPKEYTGVQAGAIVEPEKVEPPKEYTGVQAGAIVEPEKVEAPKEYTGKIEPLKTENPKPTVENNNTAEINNVPKNASALLRMNFVKGNQVLSGTGSATFIAPNVLLTVAHNFINNSADNSTGEFIGDKSKNTYEWQTPDGQKGSFTSEDIHFYNKKDYPKGFIYDLAVITLPQSTRRQHANLVENYSKVNVNDKLNVYGYPRGEYAHLKDTTVEIEQKYANNTYGVQYQGGKAGMSGGGIFNSKGEVIGLHQNGAENRSGGLILSPTQLDWIRSIIKGKEITPNYDALERHKDEKKDDIKEEKQVDKKLELRNISNVELYTLENNKYRHVSSLSSVPTNPEAYFMKVKSENFKDVMLPVKSIESARKDNQDVYKIVGQANDLIQHENNITLENYTYYLPKTVNSENGVYTSFKNLVDAMNINPYGTFRLGATMDAREVELSDGQESYINKEFSGKLIGENKGKYYAIYNLKKPLFKALSHATIQDLSIKEANVSSKEDAATIAKEAKNDTTIANVHSSGVIAGERSIGGLISQVTDSTISNSSFTGRITNTYDTTATYQIGGLVGKLSGVGALIEKSISSIDMATNANTGDQVVGGVAGVVDKKATIRNSYVEGNLNNVKPFGKVGGVVGNLWDRETSEVSNSGNLTNVLSDVNVTNGNAIAGYDFNGIKATNTYSNKNNKVVKVVQVDDEVLSKDSEEQRGTVLENNIVLEKKIELVPKKNTKIEDFNFSSRYETDYKNLKDADVSRLRVYKNIEKLLPFYNRETIVKYGNLVDANNTLYTKDLVSVVPMKDKEVISDINKNKTSINKLLLHYSDNTSQTLDIKYLQDFSKVAEYEIANTKLIYTPNTLLHSYNNIVKAVLNDLKSVQYDSDAVRKVLDISSNIKLTELYLDEQFTKTKANIEDSLSKLLSADAVIAENSNSIIDNYVIEKIKNNKEALLLGLTYLERWYNFKYDNTSAKDLVLYHLDFFGKSNSSALDNVIELGKSGFNNLLAKNNVITYNVLLSKNYGTEGLFKALEGYRKVFLPNVSNNDWFKTQSKAYIVEEKSTIPEVSSKQSKQGTEHSIGVYDRLTSPSWKYQSMVLPLLTLPEEKMIFMIANISTIGFGAYDRYRSSEYPKGDKLNRFVEENAQAAAKRFRDHYDYWYKILDKENKEKLFRSVLVYDAFRFGNDTNKETQEANFETNNPVIKNFFGPAGNNVVHNKHGAYATGDAFYYMAYRMLDKSGAVTYTHEMTHNSDREIYLGGYGRRSGLGPEFYAKGLLQAPDHSYDPTITINSVLKYDDSENSTRLQIADPTQRFTNVEDLHNYMHNMFDLIYTLEILEGRAVAKLDYNEKNDLLRKIENIYKKDPDGNSVYATNAVRRLTSDEIKNLTSFDKLIENDVITRRGYIDQGEYERNGYHTINLFSPIYSALSSKIGTPGDLMGRRMAFELLAAKGYKEGMVPYISNQYEKEAKDRGSKIRSYGKEIGLVTDDLVLEKVFNKKYGSWVEFKKDMYKERVEQFSKLNRVSFFDPNGPWGRQKNVTVNNISVLEKMIETAVREDAEDFTAQVYPDTNSRVLKLKKAIFKAYLDQTKDFRTSIFGGK